MLLSSTTGINADAAHNYEELLKEIATQTNNDIIVLFIVMGVIITMMMPLLFYIIKTQKSTRETNLEEKKTLIDVIERNSKAFGELQGVIDVNNTTIGTMLATIDNNTRSTNNKIRIVLDEQKHMSEKLDRVVNDHDKLLDGIRKAEEHTTTMDELYDLASDVDETVHEIKNELYK